MEAPLNISFFIMWQQTTRGSCVLPHKDKTKYLLRSYLDLTRSLCADKTTWRWCWEFSVTELLPESKMVEVYSECADEFALPFKGWADLLKLSQFNLNRDLWSFSLMPAPPYFPLILFAPPSAAIAIQCFLVPLLCLFLWCSSPTLLGSCYSLLSSLFCFLQHPLISSLKLSWCVYSSSFFQLHLLIIKNVFISLSLSLSLSYMYLLPLCVLQPYLISLSLFPCLFLNLSAFVTGYL